MPGTTRQIVEEVYPLESGKSDAIYLGPRDIVLELTGEKITGTPPIIFNIERPRRSHDHSYGGAWDTLHDLGGTAIPIGLRQNGHNQDTLGVLNRIVGWFRFSTGASGDQSIRLQLLRDVPIDGATSKFDDQYGDKYGG